MREILKLIIRHFDLLFQNKILQILVQSTNDG